jgi:membrane-bound lytic murein transglycosylase B
VIRYPVFLTAWIFASVAFGDTAEFSQCVDGLKVRAREAGLSSATVDSALANVQFIPRVLELDRRQPELTTTFQDYLSRRVNEQRIKQGREVLARHRSLLNDLMRQYGVPPQYLVAFWGMETNYGAYRGDMPVLDALATLACDERRGEFFASELFDALRLVQDKNLKPAEMPGSWAGAMGHMQFMPSTFRRYGVDADGNGRIDLWNSVPDALTSAAHFLNALGWERGYRWGREVKLPANFPYQKISNANWLTLDKWRALGIVQANGAPLPEGSMKAAILLPSGHRGPALMVYDNFKVIMRWNYSQFYALAVAYLADRIAGVGEWRITPPPQTPLNRELIMLLQSRLNESGFDAGVVDGILGSRTHAAVQAYQHGAGLPADGYPDSETLQSLDITLQ